MRWRRFSGLRDGRGEPRRRGGDGLRNVGDCYRAPTSRERLMIRSCIELRVEGRKLNTQPGLCCRVVIVDIKTAYHRGKERVI